MGGAELGVVEDRDRDVRQRRAGAVKDAAAQNRDPPLLDRAVRDPLLHRVAALVEESGRVVHRSGDRLVERRGLELRRRDRRSRRGARIRGGRSGSRGGRPGRGGWRRALLRLLLRLLLRCARALAGRLLLLLLFFLADCAVPPPFFSATAEPAGTMTVPISSPKDKSPTTARRAVRSLVRALESFRFTSWERTDERLSRAHRACASEGVLRLARPLERGPGGARSPRRARRPARQPAPGGTRGTGAGRGRCAPRGHRR